LEKIRVGIVNYLNTKPLLLGLRQLNSEGLIELTEEYPALVAEKLIRREIHLGLVPVAVLPLIPDFSIIGSYCIATNNQVGSVCLFSEQPLENIQEVLLDYQSRTSVQLVQVLFRHHWKKEVKFVAATDEGYLQKIKGTTAGVIIGDRALHAQSHFAYCYDLGEAWKSLTGLPFVFAVWASIKPLSQEFINRFDEANGLGFSNLKEVVAANQSATSYDLYHYFTKNIDYQLTPQKEEAIRLFFSLMAT